MSVEHYHKLCNQYMGRAVRIRTHDGRVHHGIIRHVDRRRVYLEPIRSNRNLGGFGYGYYGYGYGFGFGIALGAIAGIALASLFFW
ncbi:MULTISPECIES: hypothetical protein [Oceanobacillus]|uniref:Uncharacterized protein n=1 Tax=Oceanobacillus indicireducens TaxID=1004261 RepID=A0A917Y288_9BACI|nr:hypothetical protein [Oceanobacillus indicireducens]GGN64792.1 hypothetical protein GCM10007971_33020 [Oceanobacillus indicireducens]